MAPPRRRQILSIGGLGLAAAIAGCGDTAPDDDTPESVDDDETDATPEPDDDDEPAAGDEAADEDQPTNVAADAAVSFEAPLDGETAANGVAVSMTATNIEIQPAGEATDNAGYFSISIGEGATDPGEPVPHGDAHVHYEDGDTRDVLELPVGTHELTLQAADGEGRALPLTDTVAVSVESGSFTIADPAADEPATSPVSFAFEPSGAVTTAAAETPLSEAGQTAGYFVVGFGTGATPTGEQIPRTDAVVHLDDGATTADIERSPGEYELTVQMATPDGRALPATDTMSLTVVEAPETVIVGPGGTQNFEPEALTVSSGTTVRFVWEGDFHNIEVRSQPDDSQWEGVPETRNEGFEYEHTFEVPGVYEYRCEPHRLSMQGTITVEE
ncbi:halocyanin [Natronomonas pharaonis DSM 2160]|uniref:Halocyanin n=1 Tax=Natronomonas pharaonis (strain ATCC 35678 / DSM 2160 / CIP 103997 / JCM 8858 / NBRC 14720 / NCIMB 2260 / Gabara) TaxID=348780 RepID=A0A1U7EYW8_NATPD|nr:DUF4399 domain-containing protein [Natronomonas pharaonis]CAI50437.1 halocyanin [Natronomonas pharaonis DSM 2160]